MSHLLGIDLGTSSVKAVLTDMAGKVIASAGQEYPIYTPAPGLAEQNPVDWWNAAVTAVRAITANHPDCDVRAIGLDGQMHGGALLDAKGESVHPAIIWADQRTPAEVIFMKEKFGEEVLAQRVGTLPATGFMGPTLLWLNKHRPEVMQQIHVFLLPKDYLRFRLTGTFGTDASDAAATALFDVSRRTWADDIIDGLHLPRHIFPQVNESSDIVGTLTKAAANELGLPAGIPVAAGCADQAAQGVGNGLLHPGNGFVALGTGGQVVVTLAQPNIATDLHTFCHAEPDRWYMMGAMLSAGLSLRWLRDTLGMKNEPKAYETLARLVADTAPGAEGLLFLPYLIGERSPLNDSLASGTLIGLALRHERGHLARAIMEGVAFAFRHIIDTMQARGVYAQQFLAAGNGLGSPIWRQIVTDVIGIPLQYSAGAGDNGARGAALIAAKGAGLIAAYPPPVGEHQLTEPDAVCAALYSEQYLLFKESYLQLKSIMHRLNPGRI